MPPAYAAVVHLLRLSAALAALVCAVAVPPARAQYRLPPEKRPGSISGVVQIAPGQPAVGATVSLVGTVLQTLVQPDGSFQLNDVPPGLYDVIASGQQYRAITIEDITVRASETTQLTITLKRYPILSDLRVSTPAQKSQPIYESSATVSVVVPADAVFESGHSIERVLAASPGVRLGNGLPSIREASGSVLGVGSRVGLFIDGIPLVSPDLGRPLFATVPLAAVEQIEIVKGCATTLYGPGVVSGAINVITARPAEQHKANVEVFTGVYTSPGESTVRWWGSRPQRFSGAELMWTRRSKTLGVMVAGTLASDDGFRQFEGEDRYSLFGRLNVFVPGGGEVRVTGILSSDEHGPQSTWRGYDSALFSAARDSLVTDASTSSRTIAVEYRGVDSKSLSFNMRAALQGVTVEDALSDSLSGSSSSSRYLAEASLTSYVNRRISFSYGALAQFDLGNSPQYGDGLTRTVGGYLRMEFTNLYDIVASLGTRADIVLMPGSVEQNAFELSPSVGVAYHPIPSTSFRASISRGYRAPTIAERKFRTERFGVPLVPNPELGPEQSWQGEVGAAHRVEWGSTSLTADAAVYVHEYFGMIEPLYNAASGLMSFVNLFRARILGIDLAANVAIDSGRVVVTGALGVASTRDLRRGQELPGRSPLVASSSITWRPEPMVFMATYRYVGRPPIVDAATEELVADADMRFATSIVDLHIGLDLKRYIELPMSAFIKTRNLLQSQGFDGLGMLAPIRNVEVGASLRL